MAQGKKYIPAKDGEYENFFKNVVDMVEEKTSGATPAWNNIPQENQQVLRTAYNSWHASYIKTTIPHSPVETAEKNRLRKSSEKVLREFVNQFLRYPPVTPEDRTQMGIPEHDAVRTHIGPPKTRPEFSLVVKDIRRISIPFHDQGSQSRAKPYGVGGAVICWDLRDTPPSKPEDLTKSVLATRSPYVLTFQEEDRGKTVYIAMWWQSMSGEQGPWSNVQNTVVP